MKRDTYRTRRNQLVIMPFGLFAGFIGLGLAVAAGALVFHVMGLILVAVVLPYVWRGARIGVDVDDGGVIVRGPFTSEHISRDDIASVGTHMWFANVVVDLELKDGRRLSTNLIQGARTSSPDGATKDVRSVLQRELATPLRET